ncbi:MAG TPA: RNA methyltransferase [Candidatus Polarisedimenticolia bacterium]|nr:RNA methyltransferase [Candidatus Polarisedimenticolia bacterium]
MSFSPPAHEVLSSRRNPLIRRIAQLDRDPTERRREGVYLLWGQTVVEEGLKEPNRVERLLMGADTARRASAQPLLRLARGSGVPVTFVEESLLDDIAQGAGDQGVLVVARSRLISPEEMVAGVKNPLLLVADRIQDPGNLGTIMRVGEAARIAGLLIAPGTVDPYHTRSARASAGSILRVTVARVPSPEKFAGWTRRLGIRILVAVPTGGIPCHGLDLRGPVAVVLGNEGEGAAPTWIGMADDRVTVPLAGTGRSLNVALAAAILLYEATRQRSS